MKLPFVAFLTLGMLFTAQSFAEQKQAGLLTRTPKWAIAYKFPAIEKTTKLKAITWQVGRTGIITPVAELEPVNIAGVLVKRATLHNIDEIKKKNLKIKDTVFVRRAGDVIPEVISSIPDNRRGDEIEIIPPKYCPKCNSELFKDKDKSSLKCININCKARIIGSLIHFVSRDAFNIDGLGEKQIIFLYQKGWLTKISEIFTLNKYSIYLSMEKGWGVKSIQKLLNSIEKSKKIDFSSFLFALGIENIGKYLAEELAFKYNIKDLFNISESELLKIEGIGEKVAKSIVSFFQNTTNKEEISKLFALGIKINYKKREINGMLKNRTIAITGELSKSRKFFEEIIVKEGGKISTTITAKTDFLLAGNKPGSKYKKAEEIGIAIIGEDEFYSLIGFNNKKDK